MLKQLVILIVVVAGVFSSFTKKNNSRINIPLLMSQMNDSISKIKTLRMNIFALERIEKTFLTANSEIKLQTKPRKLYFINRSKKLEILQTSQTTNKALVKPHVFPYLSMTLDTYGNLMRKNQHYTINELGFDFIGKSVAFTLKKDPEGFKHFYYKGKHIKNGYNCYLLEYENANYSYVDYTVQEKETATSIAYKICVNDYLLKYRNDLLNDFGYLKKGRAIKVPSLYCKKAVIYLDEKSMLPVSISLFDDVGIFESYDFTKVQVNTTITEEEFTRGYKDYKF